LIADGERLGTRRILAISRFIMILLYHHIAPLEARPSAPEPGEGWDFTLSPEGFEEQLLTLRGRGYRFISLGEMVDDIHKHGAEDNRTAVVTFDDGWVDNHRFALPVLKRLVITAAFFVTSAHLRNDVQDERKMSLLQLKELLAAGVTIGGHTRSHPDLTALTIPQARDEIAGCKQDLERLLGLRVAFFAYPGGAFNREVARLTQEAGYAAACSVLGPAPNDATSLFWLYRDVLSESMSTWGDKYRLCPAARRLLSFRVVRRLKRKLEEAP